MDYITREQWSRVFTHTSEAILFVNNDDVVELVNPAAEILTGYSQEDSFGKSIYEIFKIDGVSDFSIKRFINEDLSSSDQKYIELLMEQMSGEKIWISCSFTRVDSSDKDSTVIFARNINDAKRVDQMRSDFISIASHELRTPLTVIGGYLALLTSGKVGKLTDKQLNFVRQIYDDTQSLSSLVEDLLDVSRLDSGKFRLHKAAVSIDEIVRKTIESLTERATERDITMLYLSDKQPPPFCGDKAKLRQVMTNIIDNAIKYTSLGGRVQIETRITDKSNLIIVKDTGYGIEKKDLPHIFERFYRAENKLLDRVTGAGLGLYITKSIIEMHGGTITVESEFEKGTTFIISLPRDYEFEKDSVPKSNEKVSNSFHQFLSQFLHGKRRKEYSYE